MLALLRRAHRAANLNKDGKTAQSYLWDQDPSTMDDQSLLEAAQNLQRERYKLAKKLIEQGLMSAEGFEHKLESHMIEANDKSALELAKSIRGDINKRQEA
jgi:hypothetical protein